MTTLILSPRYSEDSKILRSAASKAGWSVMRLGGREIPGSVQERDLAFYGEIGFADVVAKMRKIALLRPETAWLTSVPREYLQREVRAATVAVAKQLNTAHFIKPAREINIFPSAIYTDGTAFARAAGRASEDQPVLLAEPVNWDLEVRCFVLERRVVSYSPYLRSGKYAQTSSGEWPLTAQEHKEVQTFSQRILEDARVALPAAIVLDIGHIAERGWTIIEINSAWAAGLYGCDPLQVLPVLARAAVPYEKLSKDELTWVEMKT